MFVQPVDIEEVLHKEEEDEASSGFVFQRIRPEEQSLLFQFSQGRRGHIFDFDSLDLFSLDDLPLLHFPALQQQQQQPATPASPPPPVGGAVKLCVPGWVGLGEGGGYGGGEEVRV
ncbi:hypothetical protein LOK49_LG08G03262 [Camellia lanceoleosa]|uniref:Uncharacterized protein n=1 Tax=Camellia lanceoleosa TaxID=1840588 RepID=A0ACC0GP89_9ERIC|nr:hypothetical protein LOK49_LG08G03262 [Camellia lanceoleosa]